MRSTLRRLTVAIGCAVLPVSAFAQRTFTLICHVPPGNRSNAHTLSLPDAAVKAHLAHGDLFGRCESGRVRGGEPAGGGGPEHGNEPRVLRGSQNDHRQPAENGRPDNGGHTGAGNAGGRNERRNQGQTNGEHQDDSGRPPGKGPHLDNGGGGGGQPPKKKGN